MSCAQAQSDAEDAFDAASFSSGSAPLQAKESTDLISATLSVTRGKITSNLTFTGLSTIYQNYLAASYVLCTTQTDGDSNNPPVTDDTKWHKLADVDFGSVYTSAYIADVTPAFTIASCGPGTTTKGWKITDQQVVIQRTPKFRAVPLTTSFNPVVTPEEYFGKSSVQTISSATAISWDLLKTSDSGAADRSVYSESDSPAAITPTSTVRYSALAPGFDKGRFSANYYRPTINLYLVLSTFIASGSPTSISVKFYINSTLVRTTSVSVGSANIPYSFSVLGFGDFGVARPPDNNSSSDYDGWAAPQVQITLTPDSGSITVGTGTNLQDTVINYPFG